jgi:hypothetical protein
MPQKRRRTNDNSGREQSAASKVEDLAMRMLELRLLREQVKKAEAGHMKMDFSDRTTAREVR